MNKGIDTYQLAETTQSTLSALNPPNPESSKIAEDVKNENNNKNIKTECITCEVKFVEEGDIADFQHIINSQLNYQREGEITSHQFGTLVSNNDKDEIDKVESNR